MNLPKKRELDILNVFLCLLVIFIHVSSSAVTQANKQSALLFMLYTPWKLASVAVPGFIFISAVKLALSLRSGKENGNYFSFILRKFKKIYLPYVLCVFIYYLYFIWNGYFEFDAKTLISYIFVGDLAAHFYFVVIIMQFYILKPLWEKILRGMHPAVFLIVSLFVMLLLGQSLPEFWVALTNTSRVFAYNDRVFTTYLFYYALGLVAGWNYDAFCSVVQKNKYTIFGAVAVFSVLNVAFSYAGFKGAFYISSLQLLQTIYCSFMIIFLFICAKYLNHKVPSIFESKFFRMANASTYAVYLSHVLIMLITDTFLLQMGITRIGMSFLLRFGITLVLSFALCIAYTQLKRRIIAAK